MSVLKPTNWNVKAEGSLVTLQVGNVPITMDYNTCLAMAQDMRIIGRQAKANAGDTSFNIKVKGLLTDANGDELRRQSLRDSTAAFTTGKPSAQTV